MTKYKITYIHPISSRHEHSECELPDTLPTDIKALANQHLVDKWDHAFLIHRGDTALLEFLCGMEGHKTVVLDAIPTVAAGPL